MSASAAGRSNELLYALSQPSGLKGLEFDIESGQLGLVKKGNSKYPGFLPSSKDEKIEHLVAIATQVQNLVDDEVQSGNKSGLDLKRISKNMAKVHNNLHKRVVRDVSPSATFIGILKDLLPQKESRLLQTFGQVEPSRLSAGERKRFETLQQVASRFIAINASIADLTAPKGAAAAAKGLQEGTTLLNRFVRKMTGTGATSEVLIAKQKELVAEIAAGRKDLQPALEMVTALITANDKGPAALEVLIGRMKDDISGAYVIMRNPSAAAIVQNGTTAQIQGIFSAETDANIKAQLENLSLGLQLLDAAKARQANSPLTQPQLSATQKAALVAAGQPLPATSSRVSGAASVVASQSWTGAAARLALSYVGTSVLSSYFTTQAVTNAGSAVLGSLTPDEIAGAAYAFGSAIPGAANTVGSAIPGAISTLFTYGVPIAAAFAPQLKQAYQNRQAAAAAGKKALVAGATGAPASAATGGTATVLPPNVAPAGSPPGVVTAADKDAAAAGEYGALPVSAADAPKPVAAAASAVPTTRTVPAPRDDSAAPLTPRDLATDAAMERAALDAADQMRSEVQIQKELIAHQARVAELSRQLSPGEDSSRFPPTPLEEVLDTQDQKKKAPTPAARTTGTGSLDALGLTSDSASTNGDPSVVESIFG